jgi:hypothetical protein
LHYRTAYSFTRFVLWLFHRLPHSQRFTGRLPLRIITYAPSPPTCHASLLPPLCLHLTTYLHSPPANPHAQLGLWSNSCFQLGARIKGLCTSISLCLLRPPALPWACPLHCSAVPPSTPTPLPTQQLCHHHLPLRHCSLPNNCACPRSPPPPSTTSQVTVYRPIVIPTPPCNRPCNCPSEPRPLTSRCCMQVRRNGGTGRIFVLRCVYLLHTCSLSLPSLPVHSPSTTCAQYPHRFAFTLVSKSARHTPASACALL